MAITKAAVLSRVNQITKRSETDIDEILYEALLEISSRGAFLKTSATGTLAGNVSSLTAPTDLAVPECLYIGSNETGDDALFEITLDEYKDGNIDGFHIRGTEIYIIPTSSSSRTYTFYYSKLHPSDLSDILFGEKFRTAINHLVAAKQYQNFEQYDEAREQLQLYERQMSILDDEEDSAPAVVRVRNQYRE